jgi:type I restriction enzyme R subunit
MVRLHAFKLVQHEGGQASLVPGENTRLRGIEEFAAKPYTVEEEESLSAIINAFNERHGTDFNEADLLRFEQVNLDILNDDLLFEMLRNNPPDVVYKAFSEAFFKGAVNLFQRDAELKSAVLTDAQVREFTIQHFFKRALRAVQG